MVNVLLLLVLGQPGRPQLSAVTRLLHTAPFRLRQVWVEVVDPNGAVTQVRGDPLRLASVGGPHGTGEAVLRVIGDLHSLILGAEGFHRDDRTEGLVVHAVHLPGGAVDHSRQVEVALRQVGVTSAVRAIIVRLIGDLATRADIRTLLTGAIDVGCHLVAVFSRDKGAGLSGLVERSAQLDGLKMWMRPIIGLQWLLTRRGPVASSHFEAGGFARSNENEDYPNLMFHFLPMAIRYDGSQPEGEHGFQFHVGPMYSDTSGHVKIKSTDPHEKPEILFNYLKTEQDRREWVEAIKVSRELLDTDAMREFTDGEISPGAAVQTDEEILEWVRNDAETALHPSCTAKMGSADDEMAVVDPESMQVHGVEGLYVVDASAMPIVTNGNIYSPVLMLAEKAADLIRGRKPEAPINVPFYQAKKDMPLYAEGEQVRDHTKAIDGADW